jgi:hypothetical protein
MLAATEMEFMMRPTVSMPADLTVQAERDHPTDEALRILDWTALESPPDSLDVRMGPPVGGVETTQKLAILVNNPRMLRAANVLAEQAVMQGVHVRVFVSSTEAHAWLSKPSAADSLKFRLPDPRLLRPNPDSH